MIRKIIAPLPGNQHAEDAAHYVTEASLINEWEIDERKVIAANAQALATLALAYEQRTANLIALATTDPSFYGSVGPYEWAEIATRLGREDQTVQP